MSVVALVIAPSIALDQDEVTAHNMNSIQLSEQVVENTQTTASDAENDKTLVIEATEAVSEETNPSETMEKETTEKSEE